MFSVINLPRCIVLPQRVAKNIQIRKKKQFCQIWLYNFIIGLRVVRNVILNNIGFHDQPSRMHRSPPRSRQNFPDSYNSKILHIWYICVGFVKFVNCLNLKIFGDSWGENDASWKVDYGTQCCLKWHFWQLLFRS